MSLRSACPLDKKSQTCASSFRKWGLSKSYSTPNLKTYPGCVGRGQLCSPSSHRAAQGRDPALGTSTGFFLKRAGTAWETLRKASQDSRVEACCVHGALSSYKYSRCFKKIIIGTGWILWDHHNSSSEMQFGKRRLEKQSFFQTLLLAMAMMHLQLCWFREMGLLRPRNPRRGWRPDQQKITPHTGLLKAAAHGTQQHRQKWIPHNSDTQCWAWIKSGLPWGWANVTKIGPPHTITTTSWRPLGLLQHGVALCCPSLVVEPRGSSKSCPRRWQSAQAETTQAHTTLQSKKHFQGGGDTGGC